MTIKTTNLDDYSLAEALVGKSITSLEGNTLTLDDGTVLHIEDTADCCAYYNAEARAIDLTDNIVTGVRLDEREGDPDGSREHYTLTVLSSSSELLAVDVEGDEGSGYYVHSAELSIVTKETA